MPEAGEAWRKEKGSRLSDAIHPVAALDRIGYILERTREPTFRVKAFRNAADAIRGLSDDELRELAASGRLRDLPGVGEKTERVIFRSCQSRNLGEGLACAASSLEKITHVSKRYAGTSHVASPW